jgi:hypothetical protein
MVRKLGLFFGYGAFFILMLLYFLPKVSLFYLAEKELQPYGVVFSGEKLYDRGLSLDVEAMTLYVKSIESAKVAMTQIEIFGVYNSVDIEGIELAKTLKSFVPLYIDEIKIKHSLVAPTTLYATAEGGFGEASVTFNLLTRKLHVKLQPSQKMLKNYRSTLRTFKKSKEGGYTYDANL